jgi:hypothetical protein
MGRFTKALRQEAESREAEVRAKINLLDKDGLVIWCKEEIRQHKAIMSMAQSCLDPKPIISRAVAHEDESAVLQLASEDPKWHRALVEVARDRRKKGESIPDSWRDYFVDVFLAHIAKPEGRGKRSNSTRDAAIQRCIWYIQRITRFNASRNEATDEEVPCGISIVAEALGDTTGYAGVERVWKKRDKSLWPIA